MSVNQLHELPDIESLSDNQRKKEEERILQQLSIVDAKIDAAINSWQTHQLQGEIPPVEEPPKVSNDLSSSELEENHSSKAINGTDNLEKNNEENTSYTSNNIDLVTTDKLFTESYVFQIIKCFCYFIATIVGIFFKAMWDSPNLKALFKFNNVKPILIAPIVFYGVYATVHTLSDSLLAVLIAFQNGFFWQSILKAEQNKHQAAIEQAKLVPVKVESVETV